MDSLKVVHDTVRIFVDSSKAAVDSLITDLAEKSGMDGRTFTVEILNGLGSFAWPALVLLAGWYFRDSLKDLINRISTINGTNISFQARQEAKVQIAEIEIESVPLKEEVKEVTGKLIESDNKPEREQLLKELDEANKKLVELESFKKALKSISKAPPVPIQIGRPFSGLSVNRREILISIFKYLEFKTGKSLKKMKVSDFIKLFEDAIAEIQNTGIPPSFNLKKSDVAVLFQTSVLDDEAKVLIPRGFNILRMVLHQYHNDILDDDDPFM